MQSQPMDLLVCMLSATAQDDHRSVTAPRLEARDVRGWHAAAWTLCAVGAIARIAAYAQNRSLWYDEAALALNLARRGYLALLAPLDNLQAAPPLFLWLERAIVGTFGFNEWTLRALPLAAGIATGPMMWRVARRVLPLQAAVLAVALVTLSPSLVRYSAEVKPYGFDALVTLFLLDRAIAVAQSDSRTTQWWLLGGAGVLALALSTPSAFVMAGVIAFFMVRAVMNHDAELARRAIAVAAGWAATVALLAATVFQPLLGEGAAVGKYMRWYWAASFLTTEPPGLSSKVPVMLWAVLTETFLGGAAIPGTTTVLAATVVIGCVMLIATRRFAELALIVVPVIAVMGASAIRLYPIAGRLVLFAAPLSAVMMSSSLLVLMRRGGNARVAWPTGVPTAVFAVLGTIGVLAQRHSDDGREESRALVQYAVRRHELGTPVWVSGGGEAAWRVYSGQITSDQLAARSGPLSEPAREIAPGVLVGAWYNSAPERILATPAETAAGAKISPWSEMEARRVRDVARPCALLFLSQTQPGEAASLLLSAAPLGGRETRSWKAPGAALYEVCFASYGSIPAP
jgi:hypothetical protein